MVLIDVVLISLGLAMDATAISLANGIANKPDFKKTVLIALSFGLFQGLFPLLSFFAGSLLSSLIEKIAPWLALALLSFVGVKMLLDGLTGKAEQNPAALSFKLILIQSVSVSIDAFAVGITFVGMSFNIFLAVGIIAAVTTALSFTAVLLGKKFGKMFSGKARVAGGLILIAIGLKIFIESFF